MAKITTISRDLLKRILRTVEYVERHLMRRSQVPQTMPRRSAGSTPCTTQFRLIYFGYPTGGNCVFPMTVPAANPEDPDVTENVTIPWNANSTTLKTALAAHSRITVANVVFDSPGGSMPGQEIAFRFVDGIRTGQVTFGNATNNLTGGWAPYPLLRKCCD